MYEEEDVQGDGFDLGDDEGLEDVPLDLGEGEKEEEGDEDPEDKFH
jgi:hypothetical protein